MKKILKLTLALCIFFNASICFAENFEATVSRVDIPYGETLMLVLDYDGDDKNATPDLSVLNDDFSIFSTSQSFSTRIINGNSSSSRQWQIAMMPNKSGQVIIPEIRLGNLTSKQIVLNVFEGEEAADSGTKKRFSLDAEIDMSEAYVQQQINYTITLTDSGNLQGDAPEFIGNQENDWIIKQLKQPTIQNENNNGINTRKIKFYYALFPQKSGTLDLPIAQINGFYTEQSRNRSHPQVGLGNLLFETGISLFDMVSSRVPVSLHTKPQQIEIKPIPAEYSGKWWLPAKEVQLSAKWADVDPSFMVGEAVSRTITLKALGVLDTQLPDIKTQNSSLLKQYPEKPETSSFVTSQDDIVAVKEITNVYIPQKPGNIVIPEISVSWLNTSTGKVETATIPAETVTVEKNPSLETTPTEAVPTEKFTRTTAEKAPVEPLERKEADGVKYLYPALVFLAFVAGILLSYILFGTRQKLSEKKPQFSMHNLEKAAKNSDFKLLRSELILWGKERFKNQDIADLQTLAEKVGNKDFEKNLKDISQNMYGKAETAWNAEEFLKVFAKIKNKKSSAKKSSSPLPKLYE